MDLTTSYVIYAVAAVGLTGVLARTLFRNGQVFLRDVFVENEGMAEAVNHLLVVGFYLINLGYVSLALRLDQSLQNAGESIEALSWKIGLVLLVLGGMHFFNLYVFSRIRARATVRHAPPPVEPDQYLNEPEPEACS